MKKLTFRGPCFVIYAYNKSQRHALFLKFILIKIMPDYWLMPDCWLRCRTAGQKSVFGRSCDQPPRHKFFLVSLCLQANAEMVPKFPSCCYMPLMQPSRPKFPSYFFFLSQFLFFLSQLLFFFPSYFFPFLVTFFPLLVTFFSSYFFFFPSYFFFLCQLLFFSFHICVHVI